MVVSGELFFLINWSCNYFSLWGAARLMHLRLTWRLILAAAIGALYAIIAYLPGLAVLQTWPSLILSALIMAWGSFPFLSLSQCLRATSQVFLTGLCLSGTAGLMWQQGMPALLSLPLSAVAVIFIALMLRPPATPSNRHAQVEITYKGIVLTLSAMVDSGNLLADPVTGFPVVVCSRRALLPLVPFTAVNDPEYLPMGFRLISVHTCAGRGMMLCFRPDDLRLDLGREWKSCQAVVAIAPEPYQGMQALVPESLTCKLSS